MMDISDGTETTNNVETVHATTDSRRGDSMSVSSDTKPIRVPTLVITSPPHANLEVEDEAYDTASEDGNYGFLVVPSFVKDDKYGKGDESGELDDEEEAEKEKQDTQETRVTVPDPPTIPNPPSYTPAHVTGESDVPVAAQLVSWTLQIPSEKDILDLLNDGRVQEAAYGIIHAAYRGDKDFAELWTWKVAQQVFLARIATTAAASGAPCPAVHPSIVKADDGGGDESISINITPHLTEETDYSSPNLKLSPASELLVSFLESCETARVNLGVSPFGNPAHAFKVYYFFLNRIVHDKEDWALKLYRLGDGSDGPFDEEDGFWAVYKKSCPFYVDEAWEEAVHGLKKIMDVYGYLIYEAEELDFGGWCTRECCSDREGIGAKKGEEGTWWLRLGDGAKPCK